MTTTSVADLDPERRKALNGVAIGAIVRDNFDVEGEIDVTGFLGGAAAVADGTVWYLGLGEAARSMGPALALARRHGATQLHVMAEAGTADLARVATCFDPRPEVWTVSGRTVVAAAEAGPEPPPDVPDDLDEHVALLREADCEVIVEHGSVVGEVLGLEVARVVVNDAGDSELRVGVGEVDRDAHLIMNPERPVAEALAEVADTVRQHRRFGAEPHPLNRLGSERWLRAALVADPTIVGAAHLAPLPSPQPRATLKERMPAFAVGESNEGAPIVVACSVGVDIDLVPQAADAASQIDGEHELWFVVPERDVVPNTVELVESLIRPTRIVAIDDRWRTVGVRQAGAESR